MHIMNDNDNDNVDNTGNKLCLLMSCRILLNRPTVVATGLHIIYVLSSLCQNLHDDSVFLKL